MHTASAQIPKENRKKPQEYTKLSKLAALDEGTIIRFSPYQSGIVGINVLVLTKKEWFCSQAWQAIRRNVTLKRVGPDLESTVLRQGLVACVTSQVAQTLLIHRCIQTYGWYPTGLGKVMLASRARLRSMSHGQVFYAWLMDQFIFTSLWLTSTCTF